MFFLKRLLECLFLPPLAPLVLIAVGLLLLRYKPRLGQVVAWFGVALSFALMFPPTVEALLEPIESVAAPLDVQALKQVTEQGAGAVVILGGGLRRFAPEYGHATLNRLTLERVRYGARIARQSGLPILVSGGIAGINYPEAKAMAESLQEDFRLEPRWIEDRSENTEQNAKYSAELLKAAGVDHIVLVTHAAHMRRALNYFLATGLKVTPAPTASFSPMVDTQNGLTLLPSANTAYGSWYAMHESAGLLHQRLSQ